MKKITMLMEEETKVCPECGGELVYQDKWDELFDVYDKNTPAMYLVVNRIYKDGEPKYICSNCTTGVLVKSKYG